MHKILRILAATWSTALTYRTDILIWGISEAMVPLVALVVWFTVATAGNLAISPRETFTYYVVIFFVRALTNAWVSFFLSQEILNGDLAKYLIRPISVFWEHIGDNLTTKVIRLIVPTLILLVALFGFPHLFAPQIFSLSHIPLFLLSLILAMVLSFTFDAIFATFAFWIEDAFQIIQFQEIFREISSGILIPYAVMPALLFSALAWLPFRYTISAPVEILLGQATGKDIQVLFVAQIVWIIISLILATTLWRAGLRRYAVPGR